MVVSGRGSPEKLVAKLVGRRRRGTGEGRPWQMEQEALDAATHAVREARGSRRRGKEKQRTGRPEELSWGGGYAARKAAATGGEGRGNRARGHGEEEASSWR